MRIWFVFICSALLFFTIFASKSSGVFENIPFEDLQKANYNLSKVGGSKIQAHNDLLFVKTNEGRYVKLLLDTLFQSKVTWDKVTIYEKDGSILANLSSLTMAVNHPYDLDGQKEQDQSADIVLKNEIGKTGQLVQYIYGINEASFALPDGQNMLQQTSKGTLHIESNPSKADIYIDGERKGTTPNTLRLTEGTHQIKVVKLGYKVWSTTINLQEGEKREIVVQLTKLPHPLLSWEYKTRDEVSSAVLGDINGDDELEIIVGSYDNNVYALDSQGELIWRYNAHSKVGLPALGDINQDGELEIVFGVEFSETSGQQNYIYVLSSSGDLLWRYGTGDEGPLSTPTLGDLNDSGKLEILTGSKNGTLYSLNSQGKLLWKYSTPSEEIIRGSPTVGDIDDDGKLEVIFGSSANRIYVLNWNGELSWKYETEGEIRSSAAIGDLDGDKKFEMVVSSYNGNLYCLNAQGKLNWEYKTGEAAICAPPALGDINKDGQLEVIIGSCYGNYPKLYVLNAQGKKLWSYSTPGSVFSSPVIGDVDGDEEIEILVGTYLRSILTLNNTGELEAYYQTENKIWSSLALGDLENDGELEIIATDNGLTNGAIYVLSTKSSGEIQWPCFGGNPWHTGNIRDAFAYGKALLRGPKVSNLWLLGKDIVEENKPPKARFTFSPSNPSVSEVVTFDASSSFDAEGTISQYSWNFGDESRSSGETTTHAYKHTGTFTITLTVTDEYGASDSTSQTITIGEVNRPPQANFSYSPQHPTDLDTIGFHDKSQDPDGQIIKWIWDFGDGNTSNAQNPSHRYANDGAYTIKLTITDDSGNTDSISQKIHISNVSPKAAFTFSPSEAVVNDPITFDASGASDPDGRIAQYKWDFDLDGVIDATGARVEQTFTKASKYKVKLSVIDNDGSSNSIEKEILVSPLGQATKREKPIEIKGEKWALIVGISNYQNIRDLAFSDVDARSFAQVLQQKGDFPEDHITVLLNKQASKYAILEAIDQLSEKEKSGDLVVIYYSGHGFNVVDKDGDEDDGLDETIVPYDARADNDESMIIDDEIGYKVRRLDSNQVVLMLDACYSGGTGKTVGVPGGKGRQGDSMVKDIFAAHRADKKRMMLAASQPYEISREPPELEHGLFTYYLLEALEGEGDENKDGIITVEEAFRYTQIKVKEYVSKQEWKQTPLIIDDISGEVPLTGGPPLTGLITTILEGKKQALQGDKVLINLGRKDGVKVGDVFAVYHEYEGDGTIAEPRGKIRVEKLIEEERALAVVIESIIPIQIGDKVRRV